MPDTTNDPVDTLKTTLSRFTQTDALIPLLVDGLIVTTLGACTLGLLATPLMVAYTGMCLRVERGEKVSVGESLQGLQSMGPRFVLGLVMFGLTLLGGLALGIGSLVVMFFLTFACCVAAERPDLGAVDTVKESARLVRAHLLETLVVWGVGAGLGTLLAATVIGSVVAYAFATLLTAVFYRRFASATPVVAF